MSPTQYDDDVDRKSVSDTSASDEELRRLTGINKEQEGAYDREAERGATEDRAGSAGGGLFNANGDKASGAANAAGAAAVGAAGLEAAEGAAGLFNPEVGAARGIKSALFGSRRRKQTTIGGAVTGLIVGGGFFGLTIVSGPLEFIHMAQLLTKFHFTSQSNAQDGRLTKELRFAKYYKSGMVERTRLGFMGNHYANIYEAKLNAQGFESAYSRNYGRFNGYVIDQTAPQFKNLSPEERIKLIKQKYGVDVKLGKNIRGSPSQISEKLVVDAKGLNPRQQRALTRALLVDAGESKMSATIGGRLMGKRNAASWSPIKKLDGYLLDKLEDRASRVKSKTKLWRENRARAIQIGAPPEISTGVGGNDDPKATPAERNARAAQAASAKGGADAVAGEGAGAGAEVVSGNPDATNSFRDSLKSKLTGKGVGGAAAAVGVVCLLRGLAQNAGDIKQAEVIEPTIRLGVEAMSLGSQIMAGKNVDLDQLANYSKLMHGEDKNGQLTSWNQAASISYENGQSGGVAADNTLSTLGDGTPFDDLIKSPANEVLTPVCSTVVSAGLVVLSFYGGPVSAVVGIALGITVFPKIIDAASHWLAGRAVDTFPKGADYGNYVNYGAFLAANDQAQAAGGVQLSSPQLAELNNLNRADDTTDFHNHNIAYQIFNPNDSRTLVASLIDKQNPNITTNVASLASSFSRIGQSTVGMFGSLLSTKVSAATPSYSYGKLPTIGFDQQLLNDKRFENSFDNANIAADILERQDGGTYVQKAKECFGDTVARDSAGRWNVTSERGASAHYDKIAGKQCDSTDESWLRIRMFILDTESMAPMACLADDEQSCSDVGFGSAGTTSSPSSTSPQAATNIDSKTMSVVLDPGHSPTIDKNSTDPTTGLYNFDYENNPETSDVYNAAIKIKAVLESKGVKVTMTKDSPTEKIDLTTRANRINASGAKLAVTIHSSPNHTGEWLGYPDALSLRTPAVNGAQGTRKDGQTGMTHPEIMGPSQSFATSMAPVISSAIGNSSYAARSYHDIYGANGLIGNGRNYGNTPVQVILQSIPSVYSEVDSSELNSQGFVTGMSNAILAALQAKANK